MMDEMIDVIDENDNVIEQKMKSECHKKGLLHRCAGIIVINKEGKYLLQKRSPEKSRFPNRLSTSAAGHLAVGETYEEGAKKELKEELGIECELKPIGKFEGREEHSDGRVDNELYMLYHCNYDGEFKLQEEEVSYVKFFSIEEIKKMIEEDPDQFNPNAIRQFQHYVKWLNNGTS